jgi:putative ABC transport system permease protein
LKERHRVAPDDARALGHFNSEDRVQQDQRAVHGHPRLVWIVGSARSRPGVIGVSNIMLVIVRERTNEIGVRRAVGAHAVRITAQIVFESLILTTSPGTSGSSPASASSRIIEPRDRHAAEMFRNPEVPFRARVTTLAILVVSASSPA